MPSSRHSLGWWWDRIIRTPGESVHHQPISESLQSVLEPFKCCLSRRSFLRFTRLVVGGILRRCRRWSTRIFVASGELPNRHISAFCRFFTPACWDPDQLSERLSGSLLRYLPQTIQAMVDDSLCRRSGPRIFGISMHHDGAALSYSTDASSQIACGHPWVTLSLEGPVPIMGRDLAVPILFRFYRSPKRCSKAEYRKRNGYWQTVGASRPGPRSEGRRPGSSLLLDEHGSDSRASPRKLLLEVAARSQLPRRQAVVRTHRSPIRLPSRQAERRTAQALPQLRGHRRCPANPNSVTQTF